MTWVRAEATRWVDDAFPGFVEVVIVDADGRRWVTVDKAPVLGDDNLTADARYPRITRVPCEVVSEAVDGRVMVSLLHGIAMDGGETRFTVDAGSIGSE